VLFLTRQHLSVEQARFVQAPIETTALFAIGIQTILIRSHIPNSI
jgi:hypothetical protein